MIPSGVTFTSSVDVGMGSRDGDITSFANLPLCSQTDSWTTSASYSSGVSGRNLGLSSAYSGSGDNASIFRAAHALTGAGIMQLTDRQGRMYMDATMEERMTNAMFGTLLRPIYSVRILLDAIDRSASEYLKKRADEEADAKATGEDEGKSVAKAGTGGPKGQLPDGEDPEEKETKVEQGKSQAPKVGTPDSIYEQIGDDGSVNSRTYYDENGRQFSRQDYGHTHGGQEGPHQHERTFDAQGLPLTGKVVKPLPSGYPNTSSL